ncbi:porin family protein [Psychrobacter sp. LV10R520-6]|uniref:porin family protein n=1 Tax=Psychrobacter sp. LV10R520-6 TaxID=1415574 RepID=UPI0024C9FE6A|nr:porin family protein [Psychrobacter sp. LV10R520-6]SNT68990.1 Opacity protein [Psychrobacter sp. LV10R520-6]
MNISKKVLITLLAGSLFSVAAQAAPTAQSGYVGAKIGQFMVDEGDLDDPTAFGAYAGYNFTPEFGMEVEYVGSSEESINISGVNIDYDLKTYGIYGTYRYAFPNTALYAKGKIGFAKAEIDATASSFGYTFSESGSDSGVAGGIGLGYLVNPNIAIEAEYALVAEDLDLLTIGANFKF